MDNQPIDARVYKLLSLPIKCLTCPEREKAVVGTCSFSCEPEPIDLIEVVEEVCER